MRLACLGPAGTHSEIAGREFLPESEQVLCVSLPEVFRTVAEGKADAGLVPIENIIQGPVTETLDLLYSHSGKVLISDSHLMHIRNALGVLPPEVCGEAWPREIRTITSHEQALRQCARYLSDKFPGAQQLPAASTTAGIQLVKESRDPRAAAIANAASLTAAGFLVIETDISDVRSNKTRFVLIRRGDVRTSLPPRDAFLRRAAERNEPVSFATSLVVDPGRDRQGLLFEILQVISIKHRVNIVTIHSRPDTKGGVVFYLDLEGHPGDENIKNCLDELRQYCDDATGQTTKIHILGAYPRAAFYTLPFRRVGIVGSSGVMGKWFCEFFRSAGLEVLECDLDNGRPLAETAKGSDVLVLSVPMSAAEGIAKELIPHLHAGQLVVENCSIKSCVLPVLEEKAPKGVEILGIHTMFGGDAPSIFDQNVIVTQTKRSGELAQAFEDLIYKHGARVQYSTIESHDHGASFVQSVLQLNMLILGDVMRRSFGSAKDLDFISTPNFRNVVSVLRRVLSQSEDLIVDLQVKNEQAVSMRHRYLESAFRLISALDVGNEKEFIGAVRELRGYFETP